MKFPRSSGILLPMASLPSPYGIGDLGPNACKFVDWLVKAKQSLWQVLPFSIADQAGCPYSSYSAFGGYPLLISPEKMLDDKLLEKEDLNNPNYLFGNHSVEYYRVEEFKFFIFRKAFERFQKKGLYKQEFAAFLEEEKNWLIDLSYFLTLTEQFGTRWVDWPEKLKLRDKLELAKFAKNNQDQISFHQFLQFIFFRQWNDFKSYANKNGIKIIGDVPIFLSHHSMDIWKNPELFKLDEYGNPYVVTGAPPDEFSDWGQKWGNPNYNWWMMEQDGFSWWLKRMSYMFKEYDIVRLDHFRGFAATWEIQKENPDARSGWWSWVPGHNIFHCFMEKFKDLPIIVEDLGKITDDVVWLRERFGFPGMKILQFAFNKGPLSPNLPHNYPEHCVVYTGTHDNMTSKGWFKQLGDTLEKEFCVKYTGAWNHENVNWSLIATAVNSRADIAIIPLQDVMGLGNEGRINTPGTPEGNWTWRFRFEDLKDEDQNHLSELTWDSFRNRP
ncbi:MAG: 4-alpha-glucanotransferase [Pseudomonadota bacterium]